MNLPKSEYIIAVDDRHEFDEIVFTLVQFDIDCTYQEIGREEGTSKYRAIFKVKNNEVSN